MEKSYLIKTFDCSRHMEILTRIYPSREPDHCSVFDAGGSVARPSLPTGDEWLTTVDLAYSLGPVGPTWARLVDTRPSPFQELVQFLRLRSDSGFL